MSGSLVSSARVRALAEAGALMHGFARRTGLLDGVLARRYLWTDAFAVCNFLALWRAAGDPGQRALALALVEQVHRVLGRHRPDDPRRGWLSGLDEEAGARHPTCGGLRIGKPLPERPPHEAYDERLEWDRDGQYFHYLTRWMHALAQVSAWTREPRYLGWGCELAATAHAAFTRGRGAERRMLWKASIDLSRALVPSMGQHDPLDGLVGALELRSACERRGTPSPPQLDAAIADYAALAAGCRWETADPLGIGGLLQGAAVVAQLLGQGALGDAGLLVALLEAADEGLALFERRGELRQPPERRLGFRELGLAIGLAALAPIERASRSLPGGIPHAIEAPLRALSGRTPLAEHILAVWQDPARRQSSSWREHADIDEVMLASALVPEGVLWLAPPPRSDAARG